MLHRVIGWLPCRAQTVRDIVCKRLGEEMLPIAATTRLLNEIGGTGYFIIEPMVLWYGAFGIAVLLGLLVSRAVFAGPHALFPGFAGEGPFETSSDGFEASGFRASHVSVRKGAAKDAPSSDRQNAA